MSPLLLKLKNIRVADAKEVGVRNPAEETCCHPNPARVESGLSLSMLPLPHFLGLFETHIPITGYWLSQIFCYDHYQLPGLLSGNLIIKGQGGGGGGFSSRSRGQHRIALATGSVPSKQDIPDPGHTVQGSCPITRGKHRAGLPMRCHRCHLSRATIGHPSLSQLSLRIPRVGRPRLSPS